MNWLSIIFWLITNAPKIWEAIQDLIKWIDGLNDGTQKAEAKVKMVAALNQFAVDKDEQQLFTCLKSIQTS